MKHTLKLLLITIAFLSTVQVYAWPFYKSVDIWAEPIGNNQYHLFTGAYVDCEAIAAAVFILPIDSPSVLPHLSNSQFITWYSSSGCNVSSSLSTATLIKSIDLTPLCPGQSSSCDPIAWGTSSAVAGTGYILIRRTITISNCASGNPSVTLVLRTSESTYSFPPFNGAWLVDYCTIYPNIPNNTPVPKPIQTSICAGKSNSLDLSAYDKENDSIAYSLVPIYETGGYSNSIYPLSYPNGYSFTQPLGPGWIVSLDSTSGILTMDPSPGGSGGYPPYGKVGIEMREYRNGTLISTVTRSLYVLIEPCPSNVNPEIQSPSNLSGGNYLSADSISYCVGSTLGFDVVVSDSNQFQTLTFLDSISKVLPGATISTFGSNPMTLSVLWTSTPADTLPRQVVITAQDDTCPIPGIDHKVIFLTPEKNCLQANVVGTNCQDSTGSITTTIPGPGNYSYLWSTGDTSSSILNIPIGSYWVQATNTSSGSVFTDTFLLTADDIILQPFIYEPDCLGGDGSISMIASGGKTPYTYTWNTGANTDSISSLSPGGYSVIVTDSIGCFQQFTTILEEPDSCFVTLSGTVYHDANSNCQLDPGEQGLAGILMDVIPGGMVLTDSAGQYSFQVDTSSSILTIGSSYLSGQYCPDSILIPGQPFGSILTGLDFGIDTLLFPDLEVYLTSTPAIWNGFVSYSIQVNNIGSLSSAASVKTFTYPLGLTYLSSFPAPDSIDLVNRTITWSIPPGMPPGAGMNCAANFALDSTLFIGDSLKAIATVSVAPGESDTTNNSTTYSQIVVAAYDPNDKQPTPSGIGEPGFIPFGTKTIDYKIRFQNTGNFPASYVELRDTLSKELDLSQYRTLGNSHPFSLLVEEDSIMVFTFANINLPDSTSDPDGSQGFVEFQIGIDPSLPVGTEINNQAAIYFDFNPPIFTNTTRTTLYTQPEVAVKERTLYCVGDELASAITATGMPPYTYSWSSGKNTTKNDLADTTLVFQSGWYVLTVTDDFGFTAVDSILVDVTPNPTAAFEWDFTGNGFEIVFADSSQDGTSYFWDFGINGQTSSIAEPVFTFPSDGVYEVMMVVTNDCGADTAVATIEIRNDALEEWPFGPVSLYPNPTSFDVLVQLPLYADWKIRLLNSRGQLVLETFTKENQIQLDLEAFPQGIYLLEVSTGIHRSSHRVIKR